MKPLLTRFIKNESGATAIEYGLIAGIMAVICIAAFTILGPGIKDAFTGVVNKMKTPGDLGMTSSPPA